MNSTYAWLGVTVTAITQWHELISSMFFDYRSEAMVRNGSSTLASVGDKGIFAWGCSYAAVAAYDRQANMRYGKRVVFGKGASVHGWYFVGAFGDAAKRWANNNLRKKKFQQWRNCKVYNARIYESDRIPFIVFRDTGYGSKVATPYFPSV